MQLRHFLILLVFIFWAKRIMAYMVSQRTVSTQRLMP